MTRDSKPTEGRGSNTWLSGPCRELAKATQKGDGVVIGTGQDADWPWGMAPGGGLVNYFALEQETNDL